jgi:antitoxin component of MazEF toxin-antitoxin module
MKTADLHPGRYVRLRNGNNGLILATPTNRAALTPAINNGVMGTNAVSYHRFLDSGNVIVAVQQWYGWVVYITAPREIERPLTLDDAPGAAA